MFVDLCLIIAYNYISGRFFGASLIFFSGGTFLKRKIAMAAAAVLLTACAAEEAVPAEKYIAVYEEYTSAPETTASETEAVTEPLEPLTAENGYEYLQNVLFLGDSICSDFYESGLLPKERVISIEEASAHNILDYKINGVLVSEMVKNADMPYIYLWFGEEQNLSEKSPEKYGAEILELSEKIRELCPESMVLALSLPPLPDDSPECGKTPEYNDMLHMSIRSTPDEYIIYKNISYCVSDGDGRLSEEFSAGFSAAAAVLDVIERDRFYNDMTSDGDGTYAGITAVRPEYKVSDGKTAYLTFDDGPSKYTPEILEILRENDIKATFFITGWCIDGKEHILRQIAEEGHTVALHSYSHDYDKIYDSKRAWLDDFAKVYGRVYAVTGQKPWAFRFPGGSYNNFNRDTADGIIAEMQKRGFAYYDWNGATADASTEATYESCIDYLKNSINSDHEVVLMHDSLELTPEYLPEVIEYIRGEGYSFETIETADEVHF